MRLQVGCILLALACGAGPPARFRDQGSAAWAERLLAWDRTTRAAAVQALARAEALPVLVELLANDDEDVRWAAGDVLGLIGAPSVPMLTAAARDGRAAVRYHAMVVLGHLGQESAPAVSVLAEALGDRDVLVAKEAAWALAALRAQAAPAIAALCRTLAGHADGELRAQAAAALAAIGPSAAPACPALIAGLADGNPSVRRNAAEALASIGPAAHTAVEPLIEALRDPNLYVRVCAAGALGSIGEKAAAAVPALRAAAAEPAVHGEATWALGRIEGCAADLPGPDANPPASADAASIAAQAPAGQWPMLGGSPSRNARTADTSLPISWDVRSGRNIRWSAPLGEWTYGSPVVAGGKVFVGTDNKRPRDGAFDDECGVLMAFRAWDGRFLWQDPAPRLERGLENFLLDSTSSAPLVEGDRLYYMTAQCQLRCLDTEGFLDEENDGPLQDERRTGPADADVVWELDIGGALGVFPHEASNCSVIAVGELLMVCTSNGVGFSHSTVPSPRAPSFIGVERASGRVAWRVIGPSPHVLHGQWSSPAAAVVNGRALAFFGGGDGWMYALEARSGREVWRYDGNPPGAVWHPRSDVAGRTTRNEVIACPLVHEGQVFLVMGQDPLHGRGRGRLHAIDPGGQGDVTASRCLWQYADIGRAIGTPVADGDLLFAGDLNGLVHCVDRRTGAPAWVHDVKSRIWGGLMVAGGNLYVGDEDGLVTILRAAAHKEVLVENDMESPIWAAFAAAGGTLYVASAEKLFAIANPPPEPQPEPPGP